MTTQYSALGIQHALAKMRRNFIPDLSMTVIAEAFDEQSEALEDAHYALTHNDQTAREAVLEVIGDLIKRIK
jgi:hypothetical protein